MEKKIYERLLEAIQAIPVIDTHEHLPWDTQAWADSGRDVLMEYLQHYQSSDMRSAGLPAADYDRVMAPGMDIEEKWALVEPFWEHCRYTGYGRALDISAEGIYGVQGIRRETIGDLNEKFLAARSPRHFEWVLRDLCGIKVSMNDWHSEFPETANPLFQYVWRPTNFVWPGVDDGEELVAAIERRTGRPVRGLDDWLSALEAGLDRHLACHGGKTIKIGIAYQRSLRFEKGSCAQAKEWFQTALDARRLEPRDNGGHLRFPAGLQDYMLHSVMALAAKRGLTVQIHTGLLEGNGNTLANSDPALLNNLFLEYPDVTFDIFHMSYPWQGKLCALAKMFPNVNIDMCWAQIISPAAARAALSDFLDAVPHNKISAFGGDYHLVDGVYGHLTLARQNVSRVLAQKVALGIFDEARALDIARGLFYENPKRIFGLGQ